MTERWLAELRKVRTLDPPASLLDRAGAGSRLPDPVPSGSRRAVVIAVALAVGLAGTVVAVETIGPRLQHSGADSRLDAGVWAVVSMPGHDPLPSGFRAEANFTGGRVRGTDGCNWYGGGYTTGGGGSISFNGISMTAVGCGSVDDIASAFDSVLRNAASYSLNGDSLTMYDASGRAIVRYQRNAPPPIEGVTWQAFGYRDGPVTDKRAVVNPVPGSTITAVFHPDGTLTGSTDCGSYGARYDLTTSTFHVGPMLTKFGDLSRAGGTCSTPLEHQTNAYLDALRSTTAWKFSGPSFQLLNSSSTVSVTYAPMASPPSTAAHVVDRIDVGPATSIAYGAGSVWVSTRDSIVRIDPQTDRITSTIPTAVVPTWEVGGGGLVVADGSVWVAGADGSGGAIVRIDPSTNSVVGTISLSEGRVADVAVDGGTAWALITGNPGRPEVVRIDLSTGKEIATTLLHGGYGRAIFVEGGFIFAAIVQPPGGPFDSGTLVRIDPSTDQVVDTLGLGAYPSVAAGDGSLWTATSDGLLEVDPATDRFLGSPGAHCTGDALAVGAGGVWCFGPEGRFLARYNPATRENDIAMRPDQGTGGIALTTSPGSVWVVNGHQVTRVDLEGG
jgi:heat shock protein HslJ